MSSWGKHWGFGPPGLLLPTTLQWVAGHQSEPQAAPACGESPALCLQRGEDGNETAVLRLFSQGTSLPWMRVFIFP